MAGTAGGIPTSNILQPGVISVPGGATYALVSQLQILKPAFYNRYTEKYGNEDYTWWLMTYGGMEKAINQNFFWFENRGKNQPAVAVTTGVTPAAGATTTLTLASGYYYNSGTESPLRVNETVRVAATNVEGVILSIDTTTPSAFTFTVRPKLSTQSFTVAANGILLLAGAVDVGEASDSMDPQVHLDQRYDNYVTQFHDTWEATDLAEQTDVYYDNGVSGEVPAGGNQAGTSYFTYKGLVKTNTRFKNDIEFKLTRGNLQNNTGLSNSNGTLGIFPKIDLDGETIGYNTLDIQQMHTITRTMDVNGCSKQNVWLMDIFQSQAFSDGLFSQFPAGAFVWGKGEMSEEASIAYGFQKLYIDEYLFQKKKYTPFNSEVPYGVTPDIDFYRNCGYIMPQGYTQGKDEANTSRQYKNVTVMYQDPPKGGTIGNGIRVWQHGGGSMNPSTGKLNDFIEMACYRGTRLCAANQFIKVQLAQ